MILSYKPKRKNKNHLVESTNRDNLLGPLSRIRLNIRRNIRNNNMRREFEIPGIIFIKNNRVRPRCTLAIKKPNIISDIKAPTQCLDGVAESSDESIRAWAWRCRCWVVHGNRRRIRIFHERGELRRLDSWVIRNVLMFRSSIRASKFWWWWGSLDFVVGELGRHLTATISTNAFFCTGDDSQLTGLLLPASLSSFFFSSNLDSATQNLILQKGSWFSPSFHFNSSSETMMPRSIQKFSSWDYRLIFLNIS